MKNVIWERNAEHIPHIMVYFDENRITKSVFTTREMFDIFNAKPKFSKVFKRKYF